MYRFFYQFLSAGEREPERKCVPALPFLALRLRHRPAQSTVHGLFHRPEDGTVFQDTQACITWMYGRMEYGCKQYPGFFTLHFLGFMREDKTDGKRRMQQTWQHILEGLCSVLKRDANIRPDAFSEEFTPEKFADVLFSLMLSALLRQDYDPSAVLEIVRRTLY